MEKQKCGHCGAKIIKNPIWKGQEVDVPFAWDKIIWKNLFKINVFMIFIATSLLFVAWAYNHDIDSYRTIYESPCEFCKLNQQVCWNKENQDKNPRIIFPDFAITKPS